MDTLIDISELWQSLYEQCGSKVKSVRKIGYDMNDKLTVSLNTYNDLKDKLKGYFNPKKEYPI